jgi:hypothetical protein
MEGPTPVSALIHAATMVTAGVFLIIRCSVMFEYADTVLFYMIILGGLTAFLGSTVGVLQYDIKKVIAYSTCSQLGYMIFSSGMSSYSVTLYHLTNHAFFKALLFLSAGVIIHAFSDEQDMRKYGNLRKLLPLVYLFILIGSLALCGFPFYAGWYSKDIIIETSFLNDIVISARFSYWLGASATFFTAFYSFRLLFLTFFNGTNSFKSYFINFHEPTKLSLVPLIILVFASIFSGYFLQNVFNLYFSSFFSNSIEILPRHSYTIEFEFLPVYIKLIPVFYSIFSFFLVFFFFHCYNKRSLFIVEDLSFNFYIFKVRNSLISQSPLFSFCVLQKVYNFYYNKNHNTYFRISLFFRVFIFFLWRIFVYFYQLIFFLVRNFSSIIVLFFYYIRYYFWVFYNKKWHFDMVYNLFVNKVILNSAYSIFFKLIDKGLLEILGPKGLNLFILKLSKYFEQFHIGNLYYMLTYFFYGLLFLSCAVDFIL